MTLENFIAGSRIDPQRIRILNEFSLKQGPVLYWMHRDKRLQDNWALLFAQEIAVKLKSPLIIFISLPLEDQFNTKRHSAFINKGILQLQKKASELKIPVILVEGNPVTELHQLSSQHSAACIVTDMSPLKNFRESVNRLKKDLSLPLVQVDAHNIVPVWTASEKQDYAARTFRPKIQKRLREFLTDFPVLSEHPYPFQSDFNKIPPLSDDQADQSVSEVSWLIPGETAALKVLNRFISQNLHRYAGERNDPSKRVLSNLSPYLHFGQISAQRVALEIDTIPDFDDDREVFLEELIVRRELSDNYCWYNPDYDNFRGLPAWARESLDLHWADNRDYLYSQDVFESAETHDPIWNAAQSELKITGKLHGYLRMYWAKKILEWSTSPEVAQQIAIFLNDRYALDGSDPNGFTGIAWSIGGLHDRPWFERPVYGKVRYMNANGLRRKFDVPAYLNLIAALKES